MSASFPGTIKVFKTFTDYVDFDLAGNINEVHDEIVAIEQLALGPNPGYLHDPLHQANTVGALLDQLDTGKAAVTHTHTFLPTLNSFGGLSSGLYLVAGASAGAGTLQAMNNGQIDTLNLQPDGGDLIIGSATAAPSQITAYGNFTSTNGMITVGGLTVNDASSFLYVGIAPGGNINFGNGCLVYAQGSETVIDGRQDSTKLINGQVTISTDGPSAVTTANVDANYWNAANLVLKSTLNSRVSLATYSYPPLVLNTGVVSGGFVLTTDVLEVNLGYQTFGTDGNLPVATTGTGYVTVTTSGTNPNTAVPYGRKAIRHGVGSVLALNPVSFSRPHPLGLQEAEYSAGDVARYSTPFHGFLLEEMEQTIPEVVHYLADGTPYGIDHTALVPVLVSAMKEQQSQIDDLETQLQTLQAQVGQLLAQGDSTS